MTTTPLKLEVIVYTFDLVYLVPLTLVVLIVTLALPRNTARIWKRVGWGIVLTLCLLTGRVWWLWQMA